MKNKIKRSLTAVIANFGLSCAYVTFLLCQSVPATANDQQSIMVETRLTNLENSCAQDILNIKALTERVEALEAQAESQHRLGRALTDSYVLTDQRLAKLEGR